MAEARRQGGPVVPLKAEKSLAHFPQCRQMPVGIPLPPIVIRDDLKPPIKQFPEVSGQFGFQGRGRHRRIISRGIAGLKEGGGPGGRVKSDDRFPACSPI